MPDEQEQGDAEVKRMLALLDRAEATGDEDLRLFCLEGLDLMGYFEPPDEEVQPSAADTLDVQTSNE